jgi:hypothetical protein
MSKVCPLWNFWPVVSHRRMDTSSLVPIAWPHGSSTSSIGVTKAIALIDPGQPKEKGF